MDGRIVVSNRKAFHEFTMSDRFEAGLVLTGTEVKSIRQGKVNLSDAWVEVDEYGEAYLRDAHVAKYSHGSYMNHEEQRPRKLLLKRRELLTLAEKIQEKGFTVLPLKIYIKDQLIKVEIAVGKAKKLHDKRDSVKEREANREMARAVRGRR